MDISGKIKEIGNTQIIGTSNFQKRDLVIVTNEQYPQTLLLEFIQDKCRLLDSLIINDDVTISINLRGREWINRDGEARYFNSFQSWRIIKKDNRNTPPPLPVLRSKDKDLPF